jgi:hypothetical protein
MAEDQATAATPADGAPAPHPSDNVPVEVVTATDASAKPAPAVADTEPADGGTATTASEPTGEGGKKPPKLPDWAEKKLAESSFEAREAKRRAKELEDKVAAYEAVEKARAAAPPAPNAADDAAARANAPDGGYKSQAEFDAAVAAEAGRREAAARAQQAAEAFDAKCNAAYAKGKETFADDFDGAVKNLQSVGAMQREVLDLVLETEDPAKVLYELGSDPDKAAALIAMPPAKRALEIARIAVVPPPKSKPANLSNAPRPVTPVDGSARVSSEPSDEDDDETFFRKREAQLAARAGA